MRYTRVRNPPHVPRNGENRGRLVPFWWELTICTDITVQICNEERTVFLYVNSCDHVDPRGRPIGKLVGIFSRKEEFRDSFNVDQEVGPAVLDDISPDNADDLAEVLKMAAAIARKNVATNRLAIP